VKTAQTHKKWLEKHGHWVQLTRRADMRKRAGLTKAKLSDAVPATTLPVDCTGNGAVSCPMLGNDQYGDCGPVMCAHVDEIRTFGQGKTGFGEMPVNQTALISQYEQISGGDNGTDEDMLVGSAGIWTPAGGGIAGDSCAVVADHLDVDVTDARLAQYCIDNFYAVCMAWSVPDDFLSGFAPGASWLDADTPDENNGHFSPLADIDADGNYRLWTWGSWCWVSPAFLASVDPECFVTFSGLQFDKAGFDSHRRHVSDQAAAWAAIGGSHAAVQATVDRFPPKA
jgi:hypothetical protein